MNKFNLKVGKTYRVKWYSEKWLRLTTAVITSIKDDFVVFETVRTPKIIWGLAMSEIEDARLVHDEINSKRFYSMGV